MTSFPAPPPEDEATAARRERFTSACPRHPEPPHAATFTKELWIGTQGDMHPSLACAYPCGCLLTVQLDTDTEPRFIR